MSLRRQALAAGTLLTALSLFGCSSVPGAAPADDPTVALINGVPLKTSSLTPTLLDLAGAEALRELVLEQMLASRRAAAGVTISDSAIDEEVARLKQERLDVGVSPERIRRVAERNAVLRALASPGLTVTDAQVAQLHAIRHGPRARISVIVVSDERAAAGVLGRVKGESDAVFAAAAQAQSVDASSARGGLLGVVSPIDPALPLGLRNAVGAATAGDTLGPILVPSGVAVVRVHELIGPSGEAFESLAPAARDALKAELRERQEREAIEMLAERLISQAAITIMDSRLGRAWPSVIGVTAPR